MRTASNREKISNLHASLQMLQTAFLLLPLRPLLRYARGPPIRARNARWHEDGACCTDRPKPVQLMGAVGSICQSCPVTGPLLKFEFMARWDRQHKPWFTERLVEYLVEINSAELYAIPRYLSMFVVYYSKNQMVPKSINLI